MGRKPDHGERMGPSIYVKFPPVDDEALRHIADAEMRPISSLIRRIVREWLAQREADQRPKQRRAVG